MTFQCTGCGRLLPPDEFYPEPRTRRGYRSQCKRCHMRQVMQGIDPVKRAATQRRYRDAHREELAAKARIYRRTHVAERNATQAAYYLRNRTQVLAKVKARRIARRLAAGLPAIGKPGRPRLNIQGGH